MSSGSPQRPAGNARQQLLAARRIVLQRLRRVGAHIARRDRIHVDALGGPFVREQLGEARDAVLRGRVGRHADAADLRQDRRHVDDLAASSARDRTLGERLREEEHALEVDIDHVVPVLLGELQRIGAADDAGIVDQDVGAAGPARSSRRGCARPARCWQGPPRWRDSRRPRPSRPSRSRPATSARRPRSAHRLRQRDRDRLPDSAARAGDDGGLGREVERARHCHDVIATAMAMPTCASPARRRNH